MSAPAPSGGVIVVAMSGPPSSRVAGLGCGALGSGVAGPAGVASPVPVEGSVLAPPVPVDGAVLEPPVPVDGDVLEPPVPGDATALEPPVRVELPGARDAAAGDEPPPPPQATAMRA